MQFSPAQETEIKRLALSTWRQGFGGLPLDPNQFSLRVDRPNDHSYCSIYIYSNRTDDQFKLKLYVTKFVNFTTIGSFFLTQEEGYGPGSNDEVFVAEATLSKVDYNDLYKYILSPQFAEDVLGDASIHSEDGNDVFVTEDGSARFVFEA